MKQFGKYPLKKERKVPTATRGGYTDFFAKTSENPLTGEVNGLKAAKGEERLARALKKKMKNGSVQNFYFRSSPGLPKGIPGWKELDFEIQTIYGTVAISVEGAEFVHRGETKKNQDKINEMLIMNRLQSMGRPVDKIHKVFDYELTTQTDAEKALRKIGIR